MVDRGEAVSCQPLPPRLPANRLNGEAGLKQLQIDSCEQDGGYTASDMGASDGKAPDGSYFSPRRNPPSSSDCPAPWTPAARRAYARHLTAGGSRRGTRACPLLAHPTPPAAALAERRARGGMGGAQYRTLRIPAEIRAHAGSLAAFAASRPAQLRAARLRQPYRPLALIQPNGRTQHSLHRQPQHDGHPALPGDSGGDGKARLGV